MYCNCQAFLTITVLFFITSVLDSNRLNNLHLHRYFSATSPSPGSIRLVNGISTNEGRIEIYYQDSWGTVCDDEWTIQNGHVACRQLGYTEGKPCVF